MKALRSVGDFLIEAGFFLLGIIPAIFIVVCGLMFFRDRSGSWEDIKRQGFFYFVFSVCYQAGLIIFLFLYIAIGLFIPKGKERRCCYV